MTESPAPELPTAEPTAEPATPESSTAELPASGSVFPCRLVISKIGVDAPVVEGDTDEDLKKGIGHRIGTANPGEQGNMVVSAHNDIHGEIFRHLVKLEAGDEVLIHTNQGAFRYIVSKLEIVLPTNVEVMNPTDHPALTMITCYPYLVDTHRIVVLAELAK
jgi:sortase A